MMETRYGFNIPAGMRESFGYLVKGVSDHAHKELQPDEVLKIFTDSYVNIETPYLGSDYALVTYTEHALEVRSSSKAVSYVALQKGKDLYWGVGIHSDIIRSSISALVSALNRMMSGQQK